MTGAHRPICRCGHTRSYHQLAHDTTGRLVCFISGCPCVDYEPAPVIDIHSPLLEGDNSTGLCPRQDGANPG